MSGNTKSVHKELVYTCVVSQGSVLGPLVLLYVNDLKNYYKFSWFLYLQMMLICLNPI